jgi:hypothetical protein
MGKDAIGAEAVVADAVGVDVTAGVPLEGTGVGEASLDGAGLALVASGRGVGEATGVAQPTTENERHRSARARYMGPTLRDAQSRVAAEFASSIGRLHGLTKRIPTISSSVR